MAVQRVVGNTLLHTMSHKHELIAGCVVYVIEMYRLTKLLTSHSTHNMFTRASHDASLKALTMPV